MRKIKFACWNVNGLRAIAKKGFFEWMDATSPDFVCIQEAKISEDAIPKELMSPSGYSLFISCAERKGYSGVAVYSKKKPNAVVREMGIKKFDSEGRYIRLDFDDFSLLNIYYPNGKASPERLKYKMEFYEAFLKHAEKLRKEGRKLVICGDFNTAHKAIDLARPKENEDISGFLPEERDWMDRFTKKGYLDAFRHFKQEPNCYTWWSLRTAARQRNVGWRIDYFFVSEELKNNLAKAEIHSEVMGSDHCPISLELKF
ncbi:MAG: exodeoxyribonuclease III [Candidatus Obscuribacterales bacterium]|nr:exodeoxyribonuclease III [Candidatus Obscuribacterales bacterium]